MARIFMVMVCLVGLHFPTSAPGQGKLATGAQVNSIPSRRWNSRGLGALIEGACLGVKGDHVRIAAGGDERLIPVELFHPEDVEMIRKHFDIKDAFPVQEKTDAPPRAECHMLHTFAGGVFPAAVITGRKDQIIFLVDEKGLRYRVPFFMFAVGVKGSVVDQITKLEGKPFQPVDDTKPKVAAVSPQPRPIKPTSNPASPQPKPNPVQPKPDKVGKVGEPKPPIPMPAVVINTPAKPAEIPQPKGEERDWHYRGGKITRRGALIDVVGPAARILTPEGKVQSMPLELLEDADRQYAEALAKNGKIAEAPHGTLTVAHQTAQFVMTASGKPQYVLDGRTLHALSASGQPVGKKFSLPAEYQFLRDRKEYWVAATQKELHLLDKKTFQLLEKHELWRYKKINDLSLDPTRPVAVVSVEHVLDETRKNPAENQRIVLVEEKTGKVHEPKEAYGAWVRMHPSGKYLLAGFHAAFKNGPEHEFDATGRMVPRLNYEHIDILNRFRLDGFELQLDEQFENAGTNGQGVVLSPDGKRVSYLSFTGYPTLSYNVASLAAEDFKQKPVNFAMKGKADCKRFFFSPQSDLAASPITGGAVIFDTHSGTEVENALPADADLKGAAIHAVAFAADGKHLVFIASRDGSPKYVKVVALAKTAR